MSASVGRDEAGAPSGAVRREQDPDQRPFFRHSYLEDEAKRPLDAQRFEHGTGTKISSTGRTLSEHLAKSGDPLPQRRASVFKEQLSSAAHSRDNSNGQQLETNVAGQENTTGGQQEAPKLTEATAPPPVQEPRKRRKKRGNLESEELRDLTELAAPAPIEDSRKSTREDLESAEKKSTSPPDASLQCHPLTHVYTIGYLIFFSIFGVLARQGTEWLTFYPGAPVVISNLWANFGGTFFMGFLSEDRQIFQQEWGNLSSEQLSRPNSEELRAAHTKVKKTIPLFIGLTVGFCGSYTSFSTFMRDIFLAISNNVPTPQNHPGPPLNVNTTVSRNGGYSFEAAIAILILTVTVNVSALYFGAHCALALDGITPTMPFRLTRIVLDPIMLVLGVGCWIGAIVLSIIPPDRPGGTLNRPWDQEVWRGDVVFALVFAPAGCITRYYLSLYLNSLVPSFPLGTFAANMFGTAVLGMCYDLQHISFGRDRLVGGGRVGCQVLQGVQDGYSGALTTVSTWANELRSLRNKHAYCYGAVSVLVGTGLLVIIMGSVRWTVGFGELACHVLVT